MRQLGKLIGLCRIRFESAAQDSRHRQFESAALLIFRHPFSNRHLNRSQGSSGLCPKERGAPDRTAKEDVEKVIG
jgi:hypothetical protein